MVSDDEAILLCPRVADCPIPDVPAEIQICRAGCLERIWVAHSSGPIIKERMARPVCLVCGEKIIAEDPDPQLVPPTHWQQKEVAGWFAARARYEAARKKR